MEKTVFEKIRENKEMLMIIKTDHASYRTEICDFDPRAIIEIVMQRNGCEDTEYHVLRKIPLSAGPTTAGALDFLLETS